MAVTVRGTRIAQWMAATATLTLTTTTAALSLPTTFPTPSEAFKTVSGFPVCRYALGGAARSQQPSSLPSLYYDILSSEETTADNNRTFPKGAPFYFYYNPHRYPAFMSGIEEVCSQNSRRRQDLFIASGGTERSHQDMEERLKDALEKCGGDYLDLFILEYICPYEVDSNKKILKTNVLEAIQQAQSWKDKGRIRYIGASTHSHRVGGVLATMDEIDTVMLRYSMSHKDAAEHLSFPACACRDKPVLAFTTTRWNSMQEGHIEWNEDAPSTGECISFALACQPPVEVALHSARDEDELREALEGCREMSPDEIKTWRSYGDLDWTRDGFDEYPDERQQ